MTITNLPPDRPIPDADDLRLLAELINNVSIPLANAAWNARMSQAEAAARLVAMAERGLPLRLVADGDRTALWHIAQAGPAVRTAPAQPAQPVPAVQPVAQAVAADAPAAPAAAASPEPGSASDAAPSDAGAAPSMTSMTMFAEAVPEVSATPLAPDSAGGTAVLAAEAPPALPVAVQLPGTPDLSEHEAEPVQAPHVPEHEAGQSESSPVQEAEPNQPAAKPESVAEPQPVDAQPAAAPQPIAEPQPAAPPAPRWAQHHVTGPAAEQLLVTIVEVRDPGDEAMAAAGRPIAPGYRAILVRSWVANVGSVFYPASADANLVVETDRHELLGRSGPPPAPYPGFAIGIGPGQAADGWSLFIVPAGTVLAGLKWCIRPDIPQTIVGWPITP